MPLEWYAVLNFTCLAIKATISDEREELPMKKVLLATAAVSITMISTLAFAAGDPGEAIFKAKCASCHPKGGNIIKPKATLKGKTDPAAIIAQVRKGGGAMKAFDAKAISDADAKLLADYIIKTFKK